MENASKACYSWKLCYFAYLANLPRVPLVRVLGVILQRFRASEFMIARRSSTDVALACDLACKACHGSRYCGSLVEVFGHDRNGGTRTLIDLAENYDSGEAGFGVARDCRVEDIDAW